MARYYNPRKHEAEKRFPHRVDILVPPRIGLGNRLNEMIAWCRTNMAEGFWDHHGHRDKLVPGTVPNDYARFYFMNEEDAKLFAWVWRS
ncbi:hypothetical protein [Rhodospirillaceae bacterium SYSU D60014]|uniref:hypothetical protein n=1 Tax=Virgifigura deserti TaxID=2268457 RepID=UPI000E673C7F